MFSVFLHFLRVYESGSGVTIRAQIVVNSEDTRAYILNQSRCPGPQLLQTSDPSYLPWVQNPMHAYREIPVAPLMVCWESDHQRLQLTLKITWTH